MPIIRAVVVDCHIEDVFAYLDDLARHGEWQDRIVDIDVLTDAPTRVGSRARETRKVPGGPRQFTYEITEHDPPSRAGFRVIDGPVRPHGTISVSPVDGGSRSRVDFEIEFEGHGFGKILLPLVRRDAGKEVPKNLQRLKERLEAGA